MIYNGRYGSGICALSIFLRQTRQAGAIPAWKQETRLCIISGIDSKKVNMLSLSSGQQLYRAGFLQQLPAAITEAAQQLTGLQDSPEAIQQGFSITSCRPAHGLGSVPTAWQLVSVYSNSQQLLSVLQREL
jgi:hypothetical protein